MKKILFVIFLFGLFSAPSFAAVNWTNDATHAAYTVDSEGSTTSKSSFGWDETPWLYVKIPSYPSTSVTARSNRTYLSDNWNFGDRGSVEARLTSAKIYPLTPTVTGDGLDFWVSPLNWTSIRQAGAWEIYDINYKFERRVPGIRGATIISILQQGDFIGDSGIVNFSVGSPVVTPEPASMSLFGLGAGVLALSKRRKLKNTPRS